MKHKSIVWILLLSFVVLLTVSKWYYEEHPNQVSVKPEKLSLVNETSHELMFLNKSSAEGKDILRKMYGGYTDHILEDKGLLISTPSAAEFSLPQLWHNGQPYFIREHPALKYRLWEYAPPDVTLLGSSIFFCDFSRETFFNKYPDKKLLDFTTGNNTPYIAGWMLRYADSIGLRLKPGTIVLYGMNRVEMLESYKDSWAHEYVKEAIRQEKQQAGAGQRIASFLHIPELKYDVTNQLKKTYDKIFRQGNLYRKEVSKQHLAGEQEFIQYIKRVATPSDITYTFSPDRVKELVAIHRFLGERGCRLVVLKLPQSLYNDIIMNTTGCSYFDMELAKLEQQGIECIDVSDMGRFNITQLDYIWPGNIFDPEHLNVQGAGRFTRALIEQVIDTLFKQQEINSN